MDLRRILGEDDTSPKRSPNVLMVPGRVDLRRLSVFFTDDDEAVW